MQNYTIKEIKSWGSNDMFSVLFQEYTSEPVDFQSPGAAPKAGDVLIGKIENYTTSKGGSRLKFVTRESQAKEDDKQLEINTSWAIGIAVQIAPSYEKDAIKAAAEMLLEIKQELKEKR